MKNNMIKFPSLLGARFRASTSKNIENVDNYIFYGDKVVLKIRNVTPSVYDMWLFFQLMEKFQKESVELVDTENDFEDKEVSIEAKNEIKDRMIEKYSDKRLVLGETKFKEFIMTKIKEEVTARRDAIENKLYLKTNKAVSMTVSIPELIKDRGLTNSMKNRETIFNSLERLSGVGLTWFVLSDELTEEIQDVKKRHKGISENYLPEVKTLFERKKHKSNIYIRTLLEKADINREMTTAKVKLEEGFFNMSMKSKSFDFSVLKEIKGNVAKTLYVNINFAYKQKMTKEYLYEILCLSPDNRDDNKLNTAKKAIDELINCNVLAKTSGYDRETKMFNFEVTDEYKRVMGLKSQTEYSKRKNIGGKK